MKTKDIPLKSPIKLQKEMPKKFPNFPIFVRFLGHYLKKQCFWKMGMATVSCLPRPFSKNTAFSKNALKILQILENSKFFFAFLFAIL